MPKLSDHDQLRAAARRFEEKLPAEQRKRLGQYFTGLPLAKLLAHLAVSENTATVVDPMAGHGNLLDAVREAADEMGFSVSRCDGVEIESATAQFCKDRLKRIAGKNSRSGYIVVSGSAFDPCVLGKLPESQYGLVITNPPYVRYQTQKGSETQGEIVRSGLQSIIERRFEGEERAVWQTMALAYSGLADLSVPAWLLSALMVRPHGRLALVVPSTWRTREYGDIVRYLLLRCFQLEYVVEDTQPGWFSDALVRTHLIVARRLPPEEIVQPLIRREIWPEATWVQIAPQAANACSLVGSAFRGKTPEASFARWIRKNSKQQRTGLQRRSFALQDEWQLLRLRLERRSWYRRLEPDGGLPLFGDRAHDRVMLPEAMRDLADTKFASELVSLEDVGVRTGQGLRTGCNRFFYVDVIGETTSKLAKIKTSETYGAITLAVPPQTLKAVLRRQSEMSCLERGSVPTGRVLDLRGWVLPEDLDAVRDAKETYGRLKEISPRPMPDALAAFVRLAARTPVDGVASKCAPDLSAVRTNVRVHRSGTATPRFWYMLPDFAPRHEPEAFVARINNEAPWVECNSEVPILVDANFSTFWMTDKSWTRFSLKALLNSAWCQLQMEALGTPLGGGALKLEAAHLRQLLIPRFTKSERDQLHRAGQSLSRQTADASYIDAIVLKSLCKSEAALSSPRLDAILERVGYLRRSRLRKAA